jgi:hypothetical protein
MHALGPLEPVFVTFTCSDDMFCNVPACRSPHQYADGTMTELVSMLHKEEAGLTVDRSLEGAPADVQTFQIFMSGRFVHQWPLCCVRACCCARVLWALPRES